MKILLGVTRRIQQCCSLPSFSLEFLPRLFWYLINSKDEGKNRRQWLNSLPSWMKFFQQITTTGPHVAPFLQHDVEIRNAFSGSYSSHGEKQSVEDVLTTRWTWVSLQVLGMNQLRGTCHASSTAHETNLSLSFGPLAFPYEHYPVCINQAVD